MGLFDAIRRGFSAESGKRNRDGARDIARESADRDRENTNRFDEEQRRIEQDRIDDQLRIQREDADRLNREALERDRLD